MAIGTARNTGIPESQNPSLSQQDHIQFIWASDLRLRGDS